MKNILLILSAFLLCFTISSCKKTDANTGQTVNVVSPVISTNDPTSITGTTATVGGNITNDGGSLIKEAGVVYSTATGVDTSKNRIRNYSVSGNFSVPLKNLALLTKYYYRAYAINEKGLTYGEEKSFFVPVSGYSAASQIAPTNLVAFWAFEGGYIDSVSKTLGTANHATALNFVNAGVKGKAVQIASPGYINSNITSTVANLKSFTLTTWILQPASLSSGPTTYMPFSLNQAGYSWEQTKFFMLFNNADNGGKSYGKICLMDQWFDQGQIWPAMLDNNWHQMAISYSGVTGALRVYVDGNLLSQSASSAFNPQTNFGAADSFTLGGPSDATNAANGWMNALSGQLDEFRIYNRELTLAEVQALNALESHGL